MSDYNPAEKVWRGTFVNWADDLEGLEKNEALMRNELAARLNLSGESDVQ